MPRRVEPPGAHSREALQKDQEIAPSTGSQDHTIDWITRSHNLMTTSHDHAQADATFLSSASSLRA